MARRSWLARDRVAIVAGATLSHAVNGLRSRSARRFVRTAAILALATWFAVWTAEHGSAGLAAFVVVSWKFIAAVMAAVLLSWVAVVTALLRRDRILRLVRRALVAMVATTLLAAAAVNSYFSYLPTVGDVVSAAAGPTHPN